ncbi:MAG: acyl-CoA dehydrogenase family protein [Miltoncostaeaceae bacterium]
MSTTVDARPVTDWVAVAREIGGRYRDSYVAADRAGTPPHEELHDVRASGLVNLRIPEEYGGHGRGWFDAARVVSELASFDPTLGALLAYHYINFVPALLDYEGDGERIQRLSAANNWFWANITQPWVPFEATPTDDGGFVLNGVKPYNTGAGVADVFTVLAPRTDRREFVYVYIPRDRDGLTYHDDWDHFGFRRSDTVTITFDNVVVSADEVIPDTHSGVRDGFPPLYLPGGSLGFASILVGAARGALDTATGLILDQADVADDPEVHSRLGALSARVQAAEALRDQVAREVDDAWERRHSITTAEIVELGQRTERLRSYGARTGIDVGNEVYDLVGPRAATASLGLDRYWRDVRIHSLHINPLIYTHRQIGDVILNGSELTGPPFFLD